MAYASAKAHQAVQPHKSILRWTIQITGELLITVGLVLLLFVVWQLWWTNIDANRSQSQAVDSLTHEFSSAAPVEQWDPQNPPEPEAEPEHGKGFGVVYIPRFGADYQRPAAQGTSADVIDTLGLGHYDGTAMPGGVGNFALAGHRQTRGAVLDYIDQLQVGDHIYVRTKDGYYTYTVYEHVIVQPDNIEVIEPVPSKPGQEPTERIMTLTTCHPRYGDTERYIVHARFESWQPNSAGAPAEIAQAAQNPA